MPLGRTGIEVSALGIGTWAWGERLWGYGSSYADPDLQEAFRVALAEGITLFDTAEIYGWGRSEQLLGRFIAESGATASGDPASDTVGGRPLELFHHKGNKPLLGDYLEQACPDHHGLRGGMVYLDELVLPRGRRFGHPPSPLRSDRRPLANEEEVLHHRWRPRR